MPNGTVFILGIGSDIGSALARFYSLEGYVVTGTYRQKKTVDSILKIPNICLFQCDILKNKDIKRITTEYGNSTIFGPWDIFISCVGSMEPIDNFFACDFDMWERSVMLNSMAQLRFLHKMYPFRRKEKRSNVVFFAGAGTNGPATNYSAYCASKILLIKMCELLDNENGDLNVFIVGPGWVRTKIHSQTLTNPSGAGHNYQRTVRFLESREAGTSYRDIYDCIKWCVSHGKDVAGGRNFAVVHDLWKDGGATLVEQLRNDKDKFKLRRSGNQPIERNARRLL